MRLVLTQVFNVLCLPLDVLFVKGITFQLCPDFILNIGEFRRKSDQIIELDVGKGQKLATCPFLSVS